jgi:hypothetical protein
MEHGWTMHFHFFCFGVGQLVLVNVLNGRYKFPSGYCYGNKIIDHDISVNRNLGFQWSYPQDWRRIRFITEWQK